jgi:hypothetical protein
MQVCSPLEVLLGALGVGEEEGEKGEVTSLMERLRGVDDALHADLLTEAREAARKLVEEGGGGDRARASRQQGGGGGGDWTEGAHPRGQSKAGGGKKGKGKKGKGKKKAGPAPQQPAPAPATQAEPTLQEKVEQLSIGDPEGGQSAPIECAVCLCELGGEDDNEDEGEALECGTAFMGGALICGFLNASRKPWRLLAPCVARH